MRLGELGGKTPSCITKPKYSPLKQIDFAKSDLIGYGKKAPLDQCDHLFAICVAVFSGGPDGLTNDRSVNFIGKVIIIFLPFYGLHQTFVNINKYIDQI